MLLTVKEAAERLKVSQSFLRARIADGSLCHYKLGPGQGCIRISEEQISQFLAAKERSGHPAPIKFTHCR